MSKHRLNPLPLDSANKKTKTNNNPTPFYIPPGTSSSSSTNNSASNDSSGVSFIFGGGGEVSLNNKSDPMSNIFSIGAGSGSADFDFTGSSLFGDTGGLGATTTPAPPPMKPRNTTASGGMFGGSPLSTAPTMIKSTTIVPKSKIPQSTSNSDNTAAKTPFTKAQSSQFNNTKQLPQQPSTKLSFSANVPPPHHYPPNSHYPHQSSFQDDQYPYQPQQNESVEDPNVILTMPCHDVLQQIQYETEHRDALLQALQDLKERRDYLLDQLRDVYRD